MKPIVLSLIWSLSAPSCLPVKFAPPVLPARQVPDPASLQCAVDQPEAKIYWINHSCHVTNDCSHLLGPPNRIIAPTKTTSATRGMAGRVFVSAPSVGTFQLDLKGVRDCRLGTGFVKEIFYGEDAVIFDRLETQAGGNTVWCSQHGHDSLEIRVTLNDSLPARTVAQYPPAGVVKRVAGNPSFHCYFPGEEFKQISYRKVGTNITRGFSEDLTGGLWNCSVPGKSGTFNYSEAEVVDPGLRDCLVTAGGACEFSTAVEAWAAASSRGNVSWTYNGERLPEWDQYESIIFNNITRSVSVQSFAELSSPDYNGTVASSARIVLVEPPTLALITPHRESFILTCSIAVPWGVADQIEMDFYRQDRLVAPSPPYEFLPFSDRTSQSLRILANGSEDISGYYHCQVHGTTCKAIRSRELYLNYSVPSRLLGRALMIAVTVIAILLVVALACYLVWKDWERSYKLHSLERRMGMARRDRNFGDLPNEHQPILRCGESCVSEGEETMIYNL